MGENSLIGNKGGIWSMAEVYGNVNVNYSYCKSVAQLISAADYIVRPRACFHCVVFRVPKNGTLKTNKPPAMQVVGIALALCEKPPMI